MPQMCTTLYNCKSYTTIIDKFPPVTGKQFTHLQHREVLLLLSYLCILHFQMPYNFGVTNKHENIAMQAVFIVLSVFRHFLFIVSYPESFDFHVSIFVTHIYT